MVPVTWAKIKQPSKQIKVNDNTIAASNAPMRVAKMPNIISGGLLVLGLMSPYPTVLAVTNPQYSAAIYSSKVVLPSKSSSQLGYPHVLADLATK